MSTPCEHRRVSKATHRAFTVWSRAVAAALLSVFLSVPAVNAQARFAPRLSFDGFGTLGLIHSTESRSDFVESSKLPEGPGFSRTIDASGDSRLAGQGTLTVGPKLSAVVQVMVEQAADGNYRPRAEWANVSLAFTQDLSVRGGRIVMPAFLVSDSRKVSFANPWVRPPVELYGMVPIFTLDGVDATYRARLGQWTGRLNVAVGRSEADFPDGPIEGERQWIVNGTFVRGGFTGRLAMGGGTLQMDMLAPLFDGFRAFGPEGVEIASRFDVDDRELVFTTAGLEYERGMWFTLAEVVWLETSSALGDRLAGYATGGVRWGPLTTHATYSRTTLVSESSVAGLTLTGLPPEYAEVAAQLNEGLNAVLNSSPVQQTLAFGGRWDFRPGVALKAQVDFVDVLGSSYGTFVNVQPGLPPGGGTTLLSLATVFVF